ncbi:MAG: ATP-binding protein [Candidatus Cybelea sp.]
MREPVVAGESQLKLRCPAQSQYVALVRHALGAFLRALEFEGGSLDDVTTAAGEALANIVEHAYGSSSTASECLLELHQSRPQGNALRGRFRQRIVYRTAAVTGSGIWLANHPSGCR